jgi:hypothetical protein
MTKEERAKTIRKLISLVYDSLDSHLEYTYESDEGVKASKRFHKKCVKEYAEIINLLTRLY